MFGSSLTAQFDFPWSLWGHADTHHTGAWHSTRGESVRVATAAVCTLFSCDPQHHHHDLLSVKPENSSLPSWSAQSCSQLPASSRGCGSFTSALNYKGAVSDTSTAWTTCQLTACLHYVSIAVMKCIIKVTQRRKGLFGLTAPEG